MDAGISYSYLAPSPPPSDTEPEPHDTGSDLELDDAAFAAKCDRLIGLGEPTDDELLNNSDPLLARKGRTSWDEHQIQTQITKTLRARIAQFSSDEVFNPPHPYIPSSSLYLPSSLGTVGPISNAYTDTTEALDPNNVDINALLHELAQGPSRRTESAEDVSMSTVTATPMHSIRLEPLESVDADVMELLREEAGEDMSLTMYTGAETTKTLGNDRNWHRT